MTVGMADPYMIPPGLEQANQIYQRFSELTRPMTDYTERIQQLTAAMNGPAVQQLSRVAAQFRPEMQEGVLSAQRVYDSLHQSGALEVFQRQQALWNSVMTPFLQAQIETWSRDWSRQLRWETPDQPAAERQKRREEVARLTELAEQCAAEPPAPAEISEEDKQLAAAEVEKLLHTEKNREQLLAEQIQRWSKAHPVVAWALKNVVLVLLVGVLGSLAATEIGALKRAARIYEEPNSSSTVIVRIPEGQSILILGQAPYYYEIETKDAATGKTQSGYISKRSVQIVDADERASAG